MIKVCKDEEFPCDIVLLKSDKECGVVFVDTLHLDGETNLKEKMAPQETNDVDADELHKVTGYVVCDAPNAYLDRWDGNVTTQDGGQEHTFNVGMKNILLRGCTLRNSEYLMGIVVYTGPESKIMMNAQKSPVKVSNVQRMMNKMLYSVFIFQLCLIILYASLACIWNSKNSSHYYIDLSGGVSVLTWFM